MCFKETPVYNNPKSILGFMQVILILGVKVLKKQFFKPQREHSKQMSSQYTQITSTFGPSVRVSVDGLMQNFDSQCFHVRDRITLAVNCRARGSSEDQKVASSRRANSETRVSQETISKRRKSTIVNDSVLLNTESFAIVDFRQLSIPSLGQMLRLFGYRSGHPLSPLNNTGAC